MTETSISQQFPFSKQLLEAIDKNAIFKTVPAGEIMMRTGILKTRF